MPKHLHCLWRSHCIKSMKEGNVLFNDALNTFHLLLYGVGHMVKDHSYSERVNPLPLPHGLLFPIKPHTVLSLDHYIKIILYLHLIKVYRITYLGQHQGICILEAFEGDVVQQKSAEMHLNLKNIEPNLLWNRCKCGCTILFLYICVCGYLFCVTYLFTISCIYLF